ncbi:conserved exported hypothetical protein [Vibrio coralliirubri]|uniref:YadA C-terminal domain-containing protein n=1 Tax=Vibrio coralliirubri TaxID=1516159 RepID=UPI0006343253|nr:YadA C-terminal domain-containing protein [Vibrio coralliirubri]CDU04925.1 conserved exported hypothetical protein [Vibrio coralliirubri]
MKKTIIALTLASAFAAPAMAATDSGMTLDKFDSTYASIKNSEGKIVGLVDTNTGDVIKTGSDNKLTVIGKAKVKQNDAGQDRIHFTDGKTQVIGKLGEKGDNGNKFLVDVAINEGSNGTDMEDTKPGASTPGNGNKPGTKPSDEVAVTPGTRPDKEQPLPDFDYDQAYNNLYKDGAALAQAGQEAYANIDGRVSELEVNFDNFKAETDRKFKEMDQRLDATNASLHAVTNARPMVSNGQTAFGVGTGFAGSAQAIAVGVAHSFEDSGWSASATINQTTGGYSEFNGGAGVQYAF